MLLPFILKSCGGLTDNEKSECEKDRADLVIVMMALQSRSPYSGLGAQNLAPLLLINDDGKSSAVADWNKINSMPINC